MDIFKASQSGNLETLQKLLEDDIDPNIKNSYGETALIWASRGEYNNIVKILKRMFIVQFLNNRIQMFNYDLIRELSYFS